MDFSTLTNAQLRDECGKRSLPVSGTNPDLIDRLNAYEASNPANIDPADLLGGDDDEPAPYTPPAPEVLVTDPTPAPIVADPAPVVEPPADPRILPGNRFEMLFPCRNELSTGVHEENLLALWQEAAEAGYNPRGGAYGGYRTGFRDVKGARHAVYEISIRPDK